MPYTHRLAIVPLLLGLLSCHAERLVSPDHVRINLSAGVGGSLPLAPLVLVDGKAVSWERLRELRAGDIERIEIVKRGTAAASYGEEARGGVILIFTRAGRGPALGR